MQPSSPLRTVLIKTMLPRLAALVALVAIILLAVAFYIVRGQVAEVHKQSLTSLQQDLSFTLNDTTRQLSDLAANDIIINALIDVEQRKNYLPMFFRSLNLTHSRNVSFALFDFSGAIIIDKNWHANLPVNIVQAWQERTLGASRTYYSVSKHGVLFSVPVLLNNAAEGALVMHVDSLQSLLAPYPRLTNQVVTDSNGVILFGSDTALFPPYVSLSQLNTDGFSTTTAQWANLSLYSIQPFATAYRALSWAALVLIAMIGGMLIISLHIVRTTGVLAEDTLSRLYSDIVNRLNNKSFKTATATVQEARELVKIKAAFDKLLSDLTKASLSNEQFSDVIDSIGDLLVVVDTSNQVLLSNRQFDRFSRQQNDAVELTVEYVVDRLKLDTSVELAHLSSTTGKQRFIRWSKTALEDANGKVRGSIYIGVDNTSHRALESNVKILSHAIDEATVSIVIADILRPDQPIVYSNNAFSRLTGYAQEEVIGRNCRFLQNQQDDSTSADKVSLAIAQRKPVETTMLNYRKNGTAFYNRLILTPVKIEGEVTHYIGFQQDITQQRQAEDYLQQAKQKAEESARLKSGFLASMSHEIRTPIHGISGVLQLLNDSELSSEQKHYVSLAEYSIEGLLHIVNDILDFSKIEAGQLHIEQHPFDILHELESLQSQYAILCHEKGLALHFHFNLQDHHVVHGDAVRVRQILSNLLGNAVKFTPKGHIDVTTSIEQKADASLRLTCSVKDSGIGIAKDKQAGIFEVFNQEDISTTREFGGTGLGLSISKQLCELMGGSIHLTSEKGEGSTFTFEILLAKGDDSLLPPTQKSTDGAVIAFKKRNILIVEDNDINQIIVKQHLSKHKTLTAKSGVEALAALNKIKATFDVILMDCQMPEMDGFEATRRIRAGEAGEQYESIPIIALTANAMKGDREICRQAGMDDYLSKPFNAHDLIEKVEYWSRQKDGIAV
ncbi:response regulator [Alteromonas sp. 345S023]|uniref:Sensory/regulatory protein RpfC n=1 Tax=Alteromonas profundi TaxID=2696062 RepID=A0A7X5LHW3_9ALTE|nr:ATP-binding protein [Alteromonas profundi]NDV89660.1 response regulator [Alteromonas profundi]